MDEAKPTLTIRYCPRCGWLLRAAWLAQELLTTFSDVLAGVMLEPARQSGTFEIEIDGKAVWARQTDGGFPQAAELKRRVRDRVEPDRDLGHLDR